MDLKKEPRHAFYISFEITNWKEKSPWNFSKWTKESVQRVALRQKCWTSTINRRAIVETFISNKLAKIRKSVLPSVEIAVQSRPAVGYRCCDFFKWWFMTFKSSTFKNTAPFCLNCMSHFNSERLAKITMHLKHSKGKENGYVNPIFRSASSENNSKGKTYVIGSPQMKIVKYQRKAQYTK